ncbi:hypothetical protein ACLKA7_009376 [Drosophila subpalustris]
MNIDTIDFANIKLESEIGEGTFGKVYKAQWRNKCVAVKRIYLNVNEEHVEREFRQLSRANHINIIFLHGISIHEDIHYLIMEYADGGSLFNFLHREPRAEYSLNHVINWALQAAKGVEYLHSMQPQSVIHRDLKPHNMLLDDKRSCLKICDFGTVRYLSSMMTKNSGTAAYMAPEVFNGERYTSKCDVFSWSITMWEMQSRKIPYEAMGTDLTICQKVDKGLRPSMDQLIFDCPEDIQKLMTDGWQLPELRVGPVYDECGFTLNERLAMRQAWKLIKPFERRYGREIYFDFLVEHHHAFESFRFDEQIDLHRLHRHSMSFMRFIGSIIEQRDPTLFQVALTDNFNWHRCGRVNFEYMRIIVKALNTYVLDKLKNVCSASLERGFERLLGKFQLDDADKNKSITFQVNESFSQ